MSEEIKNVQEELNEQMQIRRDKLAEYEADGIYPFGQRFVVKDYAKDIKEDFFLKYDGQPVVIAGRLMTIRSRGNRHLRIFVINQVIFKYTSVKMYWAKRLINTLKCLISVISSA